MKWRFFLILVSIFLLKPLSVSAQSCTGDSGNPGTCSATMACPPANIDGAGSCANPDICCLTNLPPASGTGDCGDTCLTTSNCINTPYSLTCINKICTHPTICESCTGSSGYPGSCMPATVCSGRGKNAGDGTGSCTNGNDCCTNAPSTETCSISAPSTSPMGTSFDVTLNSTEKNVIYRITTSPVCPGSCLGDHAIDSTGKYTCTLACGPPIGSYTITAQHGPVTCTANVNAANIVGTPCTGNSGAPGYCHGGSFCPSDTIGDGLGTCTGTYVNCCISNPSPFCAGDNGINTAIGCILYTKITYIIDDLLRWSLGLAGGIACILIIFAGFQLTTSSGNPKRVKAAQELITAVITGLILIALSVILLNFLGVSVLDLGSLGFQG